MMKDLTSLEGMQQELSHLERSLEFNKKKQEELSGGRNVGKDGLTVLQQLADLDARVECLSLERDISKWAAEFGSSDSLSNQASQCLALGQVLCNHPARDSDFSNYAKLYSTLLTEEYEPLHGYVRASILASLRDSLRASGYPSEEACNEILGQFQGYLTENHNHHNEKHIAWCCDWLDRLQTGHDKLAAHADPSSDSRGNQSIVILELCKPFLERLRYHFVEAAPDRISSSRIDRLPEWLFNYIREHVFEGGPWDLVLHGLAPVLETSRRTIPLEFISEITRLAQWVLVERDFFRHALVAGPDSSPRILCNAIEQLLSFDTYTRGLLPLAEQQECPAIVDFFAVSDNELWQWWLDREREWVLSTLFHTAVEVSPTELLSPRAELFSSLMQSTKCKARVLSKSSEFLARVAVPACMQFLDAIHASSTDLKNLLGQRGADLEKNTTCWMELINGTRLASMVLIENNESISDCDLARVGRSIERLGDVLVDEFVTIFVETVLMEQGKLASYLMRCSHLLSMTHMTTDDTSLSPDLHQVVTMISRVVETCNQHLPNKETRDQESEAGVSLEFAPRCILSRVADRVNVKFMEVALNAHGMTPDILLGGAIAFARDVSFVGDIFGPSEKAFRRLFDVTKFMTIPSEGLHSIRQALLGLVQYQEGSTEDRPILSMRQFSADTNLFEEAVSMIKAKGYAWLELEDALSILNRRTDSFL